MVEFGGIGIRQHQQHQGPTKHDNVQPEKHGVVKVKCKLLYKIRFSKGKVDGGDAKVPKSVRRKRKHKVD